MCGAVGCSGGDFEDAGLGGEGAGGRGGAKSGSPPDPFLDPDPVREVEDELLELAGQMDAAMLRFLEGLREFDAMRGYELSGFRSTAHWLVGRRGVTLATARERLRVARALAGMPLTSQALGEGRISYSVARALTRLRARESDTHSGAASGAAPMDPEEEAALLEAATTRTADGVEALVRGWALKTPEDEAEREMARLEARKLSFRPRHDGMWEVRGLLTPEIGAALAAVVEQAADQLFRQEHGAGEGSAEENGGEGVRARERQRDTAAAARRRRADALGLVCQWAMVSAGGAGSTPSGLRAATTQVVLHVDLEVLKKGEDAPSPTARSHLPGKVRVSAETSRRLSCDAAVVPLVVRKGLGPQRLAALRDVAAGRADAEVQARPDIVGLGTATRTVSPSLRRALEARDGTCRFPGCDGRFTEAHHVVHWADGGRTTLGNCILLCRDHHTLLHEGGWRMEWRSSHQGLRIPCFFDPRGGIHHEGRLRRSRTTDTGTGPSAGSTPLDRLREGNAAWRQRSGRGVSDLRKLE